MPARTKSKPAKRSKRTPGSDRWAGIQNPAIRRFLINLDKFEDESRKCLKTHPYIIGRNPSDSKPSPAPVVRPIMVNLRLRMSVDNAETLSGLLDGTASSCEDASLRAMCARAAARIDTQIVQQTVSPHAPAAPLPEDTEVIPHYVALLAFQLAVAAQEASGNGNSALTADLRKALETLKAEPAALISKTP